MKAPLLILILGTAAMTGHAAPKPKAVTVEKVLAMSCIREFTMEEQQLLEMVSKSPRKTRDALVAIHTSRVLEVQNALDAIPDLSSADRVRTQNRSGMSMAEIYRKFESLLKKLQEEAEKLRALKL
jgi:hypothetical protein